MTAAELDRGDALAGFRDAFDLPDGVIYLDGNSLGPLPKATKPRIAEVMEQQWGRDLIASWTTHGWMEMGRRIGGKIGRLVGAPAESTVVADSTSVNLFKVLAAALSLRPERRVILTESGNFPTNLHIADGLCRLLGRGHELRFADPDVLADPPPGVLDEHVAVVALTHVNYRNGRMHDMAAITRAAHAAGAVVVWDLSHSAGAVAVDLSACDADFAVGCGYKFLNGGPGAPGYMMIAPRHQDAVSLPLTGWLGHAEPFAFEPSWRPAPGIARATVGTPPILSMAALEVGVDIALAADMRLVREKSVRMAELFVELTEVECAHMGFRVISPRDAALRGSQVCLTHPHAETIMRNLVPRGVIGDFRPRSVLRFGLTPLYLRYQDIATAVTVLRDVTAAL